MLVAAAVVQILLIVIQLRVLVVLGAAGMVGILLLTQQRVLQTQAVVGVEIMGERLALAVQVS
jgi:hypothetical protein